MGVRAPVYIHAVGEAASSPITLLVGRCVATISPPHGGRRRIIPHPFCYRIILLHVGPLITVASCNRFSPSESSAPVLTSSLTQQRLGYSNMAHAASQQLNCSDVDQWRSPHVAVLDAKIILLGPRCTRRYWSWFSLGRRANGILFCKYASREIRGR